MVAAWHLVWITNDTAIFRDVTLPTLLCFGYAGVDLFFVVSGFVMADISFSKDPPKASVFFIHRFFRLYPPYWLALFIEIALLATAGLLKDQPPSKYLANFLILPQLDLPLLGVGWTLEHEVLFYLGVGILCLLRLSRHLVAALAAVTSISLLHSLLLPNAWDAHILSLYNALFLVGAVLRKHVNKVRAPPYVAVLGLLAFPLAHAAVSFAQGAPVPPTLPRDALGVLRVAAFGAASLVLLTGMLSAESIGLLQGRLYKTLSHLGDISYGIYLLHMPIYQVAGSLMRRYHILFDESVTTTTVAIVATVAITYLASRLFHTWLEIPCTGFGRWLAQQSTALPQPAAK